MYFPIRSDGAARCTVTTISIDVPENAAYIIFTNGTVQTEKIPFDKTVLHYYAVDSVNEKGRYDYASYTN